MPVNSKLNVVHSYINGERWLDWAETYSSDFRTGSSVNIPILTEDALPKLFSAATLADVALDEIVAFLYNAGQNWKKKDYIRRASYERNLIRHCGFSERAARNEADWIAMLLSSGFRMFDLIAADLGDRHIVDDWVRRDEAYVRAFPRGTVLHLVPGNVPQSALVSLLRAIVTKNASIVKVSSEEPFTATAVMQSFIDIDPLHPVSRSTSVIYWPTDAADQLGAMVARQSSAIVAWGGRDAIEWARQVATNEAETILFGPKRSVACIGSDADLKAAARAVAVDVALYEQRACFSSRQVFVNSAVEARFVEELRQALDAIEQLLPPNALSFDEVASRSLAWAHAAFIDSDGGITRNADGAAWAIIRDSASPPGDHPLGRTVVISAYDSVEEIYGELDDDVQTVAVYPWELNETIRDGCARRGVSRIVECGLSNVFRVGGSHDGIYPLQRLVRIVTVDFPARVRVKGIHVPIDQTEFLEHDRLLEFVP